MFCGGRHPRRAQVLRACCGRPSPPPANDHRLGANEAPPAIISIFLGEQLSDVFEQIRAGGAKSSKMKGTLEIGVDTLPKLPQGRRRSQPHQPVRLHRQPLRVPRGRAPASRSAIRWSRSTPPSPSPATTSPTKLEAAVGSGKKLNAAIQDVLAEIVQQHGAVIFDGNGYSAEWHAEAEKRGLPNYKTAVDALPVLQKPEVIALFDKYKVLSPRELHSRYEIYLEQYSKTVNVEAKLTAKIGKTTHPAGGAALPDASWPRTPSPSRRRA